MYGICRSDFTREEILAKITAREHTMSIDMEFRSAVGTFELVKLYEYSATWFGNKINLR